MRIVSLGNPEVFRAYTEQVRREYVKAGRESAIKQARARGFERVELSPEALALAGANVGDDVVDTASSKDPVGDSQSKGGRSVDREDGEEEKKEGVETAGSKEPVGEEG